MEEKVLKSNDYKEKILFLRRYFMIIVNLVDELTEKYSDFSVGASKLSGMPKSSVINTIEDIYLGLKYRREKIDERVNKLYNKKNEIEKAIEEINDPNAKYVLKRKYLRFQTFEAIAIQLGKSTKQISRWHSDGINLLVLPENYKIKSSTSSTKC